MKIIVYAGDELLTGDEIAEALLEYGQALAQNGTASKVEIPTLEADGSRSTTTVLVGPASQIIAKRTDSDAEELRDPSVVAELKARTRALRPNPSAPPMLSNDDVPDWVEDL
ncbi:MAG: hypothetical protein HOQ00_09975 [Agromyces sp.]|nr:hypothetical protein [Agromyces sp.]